MNECNICPYILPLLQVHELSPDDVEDLIYGVATRDGFWEHIGEVPYSILYPR
jgi:hypothetical protein